MASNIIVVADPRYDNYALRTWVHLKEALLQHMNAYILYFIGSNTGTKHEYTKQPTQVIQTLLPRPESRALALSLLAPLPDAFINDSRITTVLLWDDCDLLFMPYRVNHVTNYLHKHDHVLGTYTYLMSLANHPRMHWWPHCAIPRYIPDKVLSFTQRRNKLLVPGTINHNYRLRHYLATTYANDLRVMVPGTRSYSLDTPGNVNTPQQWYAMLSQYRVVFCDAVQSDTMPMRRYIVAKCFEIPACGSVLMADACLEKELSELGFKANVHYLKVTRNTLSTLIAYITNPKHVLTLSRIAKRGRTLVMTRHLFKHRLSQMCTWFKTWQRDSMDKR